MWHCLPFYKHAQYCRHSQKDCCAGLCRFPLFTYSTLSPGTVALFRFGLSQDLVLPHLLVCAKTKINYNETTTKRWMRVKTYRHSVVDHMIQRIREGNERSKWQCTKVALHSGTGKYILPGIIFILFYDALNNSDLSIIFTSLSTCILMCYFYYL